MRRLAINQTRRLAAGHLWVFSNECAGKLTDYAPGELVELTTRAGEFLAVGYVNPHSLIAARVLARRRLPIDKGFFVERLRSALDYRARILPEAEAVRVVFSESDLLPGLIVDRYGDAVAVQTLTAGMEQLKALVLEAIDELLAPKAVAVRNDSASRRLEGLAEERYMAKGEAPFPVITEGGLRFEVDVLGGQKTGFYLDQRDNRLAFAALVEGGRGLDLFSYAGAWALHLAARGAAVTCVDASRAALERAGRNAALNGLCGRIHTVCTDVFDFLAQALQAGERFDFAVVDPPAFAKSKAHLRNALKAYMELNAAVIGVLRPGAWLATSSCSYHVTPETFLDMLARAARSSSRHLRLVELRSQARDHPALVAMPETRYLKCAFVQIL